ncbi:hypothetical protein [Microbacterium sp. KR10-403]|uniref:DUF6928 family protein n=1 Tax=Microbacterium sp. KR10-403 TaxID=3158581 RepID=UPI0032E50494
MGLRFAFLVCSRDGTVDLTRPAGPDATADAMRRLFPRTPYRAVATRPLLETCFPERTSPAIGAFDDGILIATRDAHLYTPEILHGRYRKLTEWPVTRLITSRSWNDMFAYGRWEGEELTRSISVNAVAGVVQDWGSPEGFEQSFAVAADNWLELTNAALATSLKLVGDAGYSFDGEVDWDDVTLDVFERDDR